MKSLLALLLAGLFFASCSQGTPKAPEAVAGATEESPSPANTISSWKAKYKTPTAGDLENFKEEPSPTGYGGSVPYEKSQVYPEILVNYKGSAFAKEYKEDRGHGNTIKDLLGSKRVNEKTPGACLSCKTADVAKLYEEMGWSYASIPLAELTKTEHPAIDCFTCHDPDTNKLRVWQPGFVEAAKRTGIDLTKATRKQMETYVCAQCHSEYYFEPKTTKVVFPWDKGRTADDIYAYYQEKPAGFDGDFTQPDSQVRLLKAQHPDFEEYSQGIHASAGVSCADCHVPRTKGEDGKISRNHHITSPLKSIKESCLPCHVGKTESWVLEQVKKIQDSVAQAQRRAGTTIALAHTTLAGVIAAGRTGPGIEKAKALIREAQWQWDYPASANSMGFHNPVGALAGYAKSLDLAWQAINELKI